MANTAAPVANPSPSPVPDPEAELAAAEIQIRRENRTRAGLVNLGPGSLELAALMDQSESKLLEKELDALKADISGSTAQAPTAVLVDLPTPGTTIIGPWVIATEMFKSGMADGITNTRTLDDGPAPGGCVAGMGTCSADTSGNTPQSGSKTESGHGCSTGTCEGPATEIVTVAGIPGIVFTDTTMTVSYDGSSITMDIKITTYGNITDPVTHATVYRIESTGTAHISGDACPDASGIARIHIEFTAKENYFNAADPTRAKDGYGLNQTYSADVRVKADDNANLAGIDISAKAHEDSNGGVPPPGSSQSDLTSHSADASDTQSFGYSPTGGFTGGNPIGQTATTVEALGLAPFMDLYTALPAKTAAKATETAWRSGMCIVVHADPNGGKVAKDSLTSVKVTVKQRYEGTELDKPVEATFSGVKALEPLGQKQPAPATFRYTAGSTLGDKGDMTFKSVSNRGIGHTAVQFVVYEACHPDCRLDLTIGGPKYPIHYHGIKCGGPEGQWLIEGDGIWPSSAAGFSSTVVTTTERFTIAAGSMSGPLSGSETFRWTITTYDHFGRKSVERAGTDITFSGIATFLPSGAISSDYTSKGTRFDSSGVHTLSAPPEVHGALTFFETGAFC
jgi:hypothetical protein